MRRETSGRGVGSEGAHAPAEEPEGITIRIRSMSSLERVKPASLAVVACLQPTQLMLLQTAVDRRVDHRGKRASLRGIAGHFARQCVTTRTHISFLSVHPSRSNARYCLSLSCLGVSPSSSKQRMLCIDFSVNCSKAATALSALGVTLHSSGATRRRSWITSSTQPERRGAKISMFRACCV